MSVERKRKERESSGAEESFYEERKEERRMENSLATKDDIMMIIEKINSAKADTETQIKSAKEETVSSFIEQLSVVQSTLHDLRVENESLRKDVDTLKEVMEKQKDEINDLKGVTKMQRDTLLELQQRSRIDSLKIYGLKEEGGDGGESADLTEKVVRDFCDRKLGVYVKSTDISVAHRLQASDQGNRHRTVIVKFTRRTVKMEILRARRKLKGSSVVIAEDLTSTNMRLFHSMREHVGKKNVWTWDGKVLVKIGAVTKRVTVDNEAEIIREMGEAASREPPQVSRDWGPPRGRAPGRSPVRQSGGSAARYSDAARSDVRRRSPSQSSGGYSFARNRSDSRDRHNSHRDRERSRERSRGRGRGGGGQKGGFREGGGQNMRGYGRGTPTPM